MQFILWSRPSPKTLQECRDDHVLFKLGLGTKHVSRLAALKQHCAKVIICLKQSYRGVAVPEAQSLNFVCTFHVGHSKLQDGRRPIGANRSGDPGAGYVGVIKWQSSA